MLTAELKRAVPDERAGKQARFAKNLKAVADAKDRPAVGGKLLHRLHDRAESRDGPCAQVIPVTEPARNNDRTSRTERGFLVPEKAGGMAEDIFQDMDRILVAIRGGELKHGKIHFSRSPVDNPRSRGCSRICGKPRRVAGGRFRDR